MPRQAFLDQYAAATGKIVDLDVLRYYEILNAWKFCILTLSTGCYAAREGLSHQDLVLTSAAIITPLLVDRMVDLLMEAN